MKRILLSAMMVLLMGTTILAQRTISGTVTDEGGDPLVGANVYLATDPSVGTITDFDGYYELQVPEGATVIEVSFTGYTTQEVELGASDTYNVTLQGGVELSEAVVTALGITRDEKSLGYSTQEVGGDELSSSRVTNPLNALSGNVAGVTISTPSSSLGGSTRILMRGVTSLTGENRPLIVVDGIPLANNNVNSQNTQRGAGGRDYGDTAFDINPDDIASVSVLKGGPAAALYGSRGANGVIMITTKSAKKGQDNITLNTGITFNQISVFPNLQNKYGGGTGNDNQFTTVVINGKEYKAVNFGADSSWGPKFDPNRKVLQWYAFDKEGHPDQYLKPTPWVASAHPFRDFFNTGVTYTNSLAISKSYQNTSARLSLSNATETGIVPNSKLSRTTAALNLNTKFNEKFTASGHITYVRTDGFNRPNVGYGDQSLGQAYFQWGQRQLDFERLKDYKINDVTQRTWNRTSALDGTPLFHNNPYWIVYENTAEDLRNHFYGDVQLKYEFIDGLYAVGTVYGDHYDYNIQNHVAIGSQAQPEYNNANYNFTEMNYEARLHYDKDFGRFSLNALAGTNRRNMDYNSIIGNTNGGLIAPLTYNLGNSNEKPSVSNTLRQMRINSVFGSISFGWNSTFYLDIAGRNDWSSTLPSDNNSYFYPSVTGTVIFSEFLPDVDWLNFGKVRAGWAQVRNGTDPYQLRNVFSSSSLASIFLGVPTFTNGNTMKNAELLPELVATWEVGLEASLFMNRLMLDLTYYNKTTKDLIMPVQTSPSTGFAYKMMNAGEMVNKGFEALVTVVPVRTQDFEWALTWNFAKNNNTVTDLYGDLESVILGNAAFRVSLAAMKGEEWGQLRGSDFIYDENGNKVVGENGLYLQTGITNLGSILPDFNTGVRNTFTYKNLSLSVLIDVQKGGKYFSVTNMFGHYSGLFAATAEGNVREEGVPVHAVTADVEFAPDGSYTVSNVKPYDERVSALSYFHHFYSGPAARNVFDADYVKLRDLTLTYTFPSRITGPFNGIELTAFGRNLLVWGLDNPNFDPEMMSAGSGNVQGMEGGNLPPTRTYGLNLRLKL